MKYIGVDNGLQGAIVVIDSDARIVEKFIMPTYGQHTRKYHIPAIYKIFLKYSKNSIVGLERAQVFPISGKRANFSTGYGFAVMETTLQILNISYILIPPLVWMKAILVGINRKNVKGSIEWAMRMYPNEDWKISPNSQKIHDGLTDAAAIANYTRMMHLGGMQNVEPNVDIISYRSATINGNPKQYNDTKGML